MEINLGDLKCFEKIGEGAGGVVQKAIHIPTKTKLALKVFLPSLTNRKYQYQRTRSRIRRH